MQDAFTVVGRSQESKFVDNWHRKKNCSRRKKIHNKVSQFGEKFHKLKINKLKV